MSVLEDCMREVLGHAVRRQCSAWRRMYYKSLGNG
jgi:hypothetical protein